MEGAGECGWAESPVRATGDETQEQTWQSRKRATQEGREGESSWRRAFQVVWTTPSRHTRGSRGESLRDVSGDLRVEAGARAPEPSPLQPPHPTDRV